VICNAAFLIVKLTVDRMVRAVASRSTSVNALTAERTVATATICKRRARTLSGAEKQASTTADDAIRLAKLADRERWGGLGRAAHVLAKKLRKDAAGEAHFAERKADVAQAGQEVDSDERLIEEALSLLGNVLPLANAYGWQAVESARNTALSAERSFDSRRARPRKAQRARRPASIRPTAREYASSLRR
jgi:hypothetical protein